MSFKPRAFGPFILLDRIAIGGMAELYLARLHGLGGFEKLLAIKKILPSFNSNKDFVSMFIEEAKLTVKLTHANIVQVYDFGEVNKELYLAMEFVEGHNVRQILSKLEQAKKTCSTEIACHIVSEICRGLDYAHNREDKRTHTPLSIIHRDISPQNIIVSYDGEVKIIDFGIAKAASKVEETKAGVLKGKFGYMSPEQALGESVDKRTDIFSAGIILFELLTRERLFTSDSDIETIKKIQKANIPPPSKYDPSIPKELDKIVLKALTKKRDDRYQTAREFQRALSHFIYISNPHFVHHNLSDFMHNLFADEQNKWKERLKENQHIAEEIKLKVESTKIPRPQPPVAPQAPPPKIPKRPRPTIKRATKGEPTVVKVKTPHKREVTRISAEREKTAIKQKPKIELIPKSIARSAITLFAVFILALILAYAVVLFIEGPSPERNIAEDSKQPKPIEEPKEEIQETPEIEETQPEAEDIETKEPASEPETKSNLKDESKKEFIKPKKQTKKRSPKSIPIPIETLLPEETGKSGFLNPNIRTGSLYIDDKLIPILLDPIELKPGTYKLVYVDPALNVTGELSIDVEGGKTLEVNREDFKLKTFIKLKE